MGFGDFIGTYGKVRAGLSVLGAAIVACVLCMLAVYHYRLYNKPMAQTEGTIKNIRCSQTVTRDGNNQPSTSTTCMALVTADINGQQREFPNFNVAQNSFEGQKVQLAYDPANPSNLTSVGYKNSAGVLASMSSSCACCVLLTSIAIFYATLKSNAVAQGYGAITAIGDVGSIFR